MTSFVIRPTLIESVPAAGFAEAPKVAYALTAPNKAKATVSDTIRRGLAPPCLRFGAGDAFNAGLLRWLWASDQLNANAISTLDPDRLADALGFATAVGAAQGAQAGANPPTLAEVNACLDIASHS